MSRVMMASRNAWRPPSFPRRFSLYSLITGMFLSFLCWYLASGLGLQNLCRQLVPHVASDTDRRGGVASQSALCSRIGVDIIEHGGNAADAMIATSVCVGVVDMWHTGLGGGGFMLIRTSDGSYESIDFRETAPAAASQDMFAGNVNASRFGGLASGVPGELRGLEMLHQKYGSLPWVDLILPAVQVARHGFQVTGDQAAAMELLGPSSFLSQDPSWAVDFAPHGTCLVEGDVMTRKRYADLLERIAHDGAGVFYRGDIAQATVSAVQAAGGIMITDDLGNYTAVSRPSVQITYRDFKITSCSAPSSGTVALNVMKVLEAYEDFGAPSAVNLSTHRLNEALRFAYGAVSSLSCGSFLTLIQDLRRKRAKLGDPSFVKHTELYEQQLLSDERVRAIRSRISDDHTLPMSAYNPDGFKSVENAGTSHVVTADSSGMAVSMTSTINLAFGSQIMVPETGLILNNEMNDFSIPNATNAFGYKPSVENFVRPGKRPLSSITPMIVEHLANGTLYFVTGAAGGSHIITATLHVLWYALDWGRNSSEALSAPRFHDQLSPNKVQFEFEYENATTSFIKDRGNSIEFTGYLSKAQALRRLPNGTFDVASDHKRFPSGGGFAV